MLVTIGLTISVWFMSDPFLYDKFPHFYIDVLKWIKDGGQDPFLFHLYWKLKIKIGQNYLYLQKRTYFAAYSFSCQ